MTKEELKSKLTYLIKEYQTRKRQVLIDYALANNPYKIGDIIEDHHTKIEIVDIEPWVVSEDSQCVYTGVELKKDGTPKKRQQNTTIYQQNIKS